MAKPSAGILPYRRQGAEISVLLVHPGGPFWARKDEGAWSIPKGEYGEGEDILAVALKECEEELGFKPQGTLLPLGEVCQQAGKLVTAWAAEADFDPAGLMSNTFEMEWPPRSGKRQSLPEVDRAEWFAPALARRKILPAQRPFIERLLSALGEASSQSA